MKLRYWLIPGLVLAVWVAWLYFLLSFGGSPIGTQDAQNKFGVFGTFGDAFGAVASLMAALAAAGAFIAFSHQREVSHHQQFETNFFTMLKNLESITAQMQLDLWTERNDGCEFECDYERLRNIANTQIVHSYKGRTAFNIVVCLIRDRVTPSGYADIKVVGRAYEAAFSKFVGQFAHYLRTLYHVFRLIEENCPADRLYYGRIIRSQLSNPEVCFVAYNCIVGEGRHKFKALAAQYSLFHNLHRLNLDEYEAAELEFFQRKLPEEAFRFEDPTAVTYDD